MKKYNVNLLINEVEKIEKFDIGNTIKFNIQSGKYSYIADIISVDIVGGNKLNITCLVDEKHFEDFNSSDCNRDWQDFDLEKCFINDIDFIGEYVC